MVVQELVQTTLADESSQLLTVHGHQVVTDKGVVHACDFHEKTLLMHHLMAAVFTFLASKNWLFTFAALLHDIGKLTARLNSQRGDVPVMAFPAHAQQGEGTLLLYWDDALTKTSANMTEGDWEVLCQIVGRHMCVHNAVSDEYASLALPLVRLCPLQVQQGLAAVHVGDVRGAVRVKKSLSPATAATYASSANVVTVTGVESKRQEEVKKKKKDKTTDDQQTEDPNDCRSTRVMSVATRAEDKDGAVRSFAAYMETHHYFRLCGLLRGRSKHGKSFMACLIQSRYAKEGISVVVVSRDDVLCDVAASADKSIRLFHHRFVPSPTRGTSRLWRGPHCQLRV
jgi:hypothetical protein